MSVHGRLLKAAAARVGPALHVRPALLARIALGTFGIWVASLGARPLLFSRRPATVNDSTARWLLGGVVAHDAVIAPTVFLLGALTARIAGARIRRALAAILLIGGSVVIVGLPDTLRKSENANPTVTPLDYNRNLTIVLLAVIGSVILTALAGATRQLRRERRASRPASDSAHEPDCTEEIDSATEAHSPPQPDIDDPTQIPG